jgi:hypothetical protein
MHGRAYIHWPSRVYHFCHEPELAKRLRKCMYETVWNKFELVRTHEKMVDGEGREAKNIIIKDFIKFNVADGTFFCKFLHSVPV